jgi:hypothetical protein
MNKNKILDLLTKLNLPQDQYFILSGASLVLRGIKDICGDLDLCITPIAFEDLKRRFDVTNGEHENWYKIGEEIEFVVEPKEHFFMEFVNGYPLQELKSVLDFKLKRNAPKDQEDIKRIRAYLGMNN